MARRTPPSTPTNPTAPPSPPSQNFPNTTTANSSPSTAVSAPSAAASATSASPTTPLLWFCSDNGGLPEISPSTVNGLRGHKGSVFEGGLRVPGIIEWPAVITQPRITRYPAGTVDIFPTLADILGLPASVMLAPVDGSSLRPLFTADLATRTKPLAFHHQRRAAWIDNRYKLIQPTLAEEKFELYDLDADPAESRDLAAAQPEVFARLRTALLAWNASVAASVAGQDYPERQVSPTEPPSRDWTTAPEYQPHLAQLATRPEYQSALAPKAGKKKKP